MIERRGFLGSLLAAPLASGKVPTDILESAPRVSVGPNEVLCLVIDPTVRLTMEEQAELSNRCAEVARTLGIPREQVVIMQGVTPQVVRASP